jgi:hypothetical protein
LAAEDFLGKVFPEIGNDLPIPRLRNWSPNTGPGI